ncbi:MAG: flagellar basal body rod protein FlgC [Gemmatimonadetes bacterium]|nr:flagellar basal body rod protein FlgC [Gemmatimonadota bacterium]
MPDPIRPMFRSLGIAASGLSAQRQRMEIIAQNIANADATRSAEGGPYKRQELVTEAATKDTALFPDVMQDALGARGARGARGAVAGAARARAEMLDGRRTIEVPVLETRGLDEGDAIANGPGAGQYGVRVAGIAVDEGAGRKVYEPGHPDADKDGYVTYPDISTDQEMVKLLDAKRLYEANAAVFQTAKSMLRAAIDI